MNDYTLILGRSLDEVKFSLDEGTFHLNDLKKERKVLIQEVQQNTIIKKTELIYLKYEVFHPIYVEKLEH